MEKLPVVMVEIVPRGRSSEPLRAWWFHGQEKEILYLNRMWIILKIQVLCGIQVDILFYMYVGSEITESPTSHMDIYLNGFRR